MTTKPETLPVRAAEIARGLSEAEQDFLERLRGGRAIGLADRAADKVRQRMRRLGYAKVVMNPRRWVLTDAGRAHLNGEKS